MDKYEKALKQARNYYPDNQFLDTIFPELAEGEDERIRQNIIAFISWAKACGSMTPQQANSAESWIAYLEKQKDRKPDYCHHEVDLSGCSNEYRKAYYDGWNNCNQQHAQLQAEQKPAESDSIKGGDFISDGKRVFLVLANVEERNFGEIGSSYCESLILGVDGVVYCDGEDFKKYKRATSDERAKFIHDLKCGVKLKERPAEWSEEDRDIINEVASILINDENRADNKEEEDRLAYLADKIQSLRPQPHWKPSEEQMKALIYANPYVPDDEGTLASLFRDLENLK